MDRDRLTDPNYFFPYAFSVRPSDAVREAFEAAWAVIKTEALISNLFTQRQAQYLHQLSRSSKFIEIADRILKVDASPYNPMLKIIVRSVSIMDSFQAHISRKHPKKSLKYMEEVVKRLRQAALLIDGDRRYRASSTSFKYIYPKTVSAVQGAEILSNIRIHRTVELGNDADSKQLGSESFLQLLSAYDVAGDMLQLAEQIAIAIKLRGQKPTGNQEQIQNFMARSLHSWLSESIADRPDLTKRKVSALEKLHNEVVLLMVAAYQNNTTTTFAEDERRRLRVTTSRGRKSVT